MKAFQMWYICATSIVAMSTATLRLDESLRARIARLATALDQSAHSFMVQALTEKVDEAEWKLALQQEAHQRDAAVLAGEPVVEWHEMRAWLQGRMHAGAPDRTRSR